MDVVLRYDTSIVNLLASVIIIISAIQIVKQEQQYPSSDTYVYGLIWRVFSMHRNVEYGIKMRRYHVHFQFYGQNSVCRIQKLYTCKYIYIDDSSTGKLSCMLCIQNTFHILITLTDQFKNLKHLIIIFFSSFYRLICPNLMSGLGTPKYLFFRYLRFFIRFRASTNEFGTVSSS